MVFVCVFLALFMNQKLQKKDKIILFDLGVDNLSMDETLVMIEQAIINNQSITLTDVNAGKIVQLKEDNNLSRYIKNSDIIQADGQAVVWASKIIGKPLKERVAGIDLVDNLIELSHLNNFKIFFFGAKEEIVKAVVDKYSKKYSPEIIAGYRNGYFNENESSIIAKQIVNSGAHILFVAITSPIQEHFLYHNKDILKHVNFKMGVGGSFDVFAGKTKRAPLWMQKIGMEWFYRFLQEPKRMWKRYLIGNTKFLFLVLKEKFRK